MVWDSTKPDSTAGTGETIKEGAVSTKANFVALDSRGILNLVNNGTLEGWNGGSSSAPDAYTLTGASASVAQTSTASNVKRGTYSAAITRAGADAALEQSLLDRAGGATYIQGRTYVIRSWVKASVANRVRLSINDGVSPIYSSYHTGSGSYELLTKIVTLDSNATLMTLVLGVDTGDTTAYFDAVQVLEGDVPASFAGSTLDSSISCRVRRNSAQSIPTSTATKLTYGTEDFDTSDFHDLVTNTSRLTVPEAGTYHFHAAVQFNGNATGTRQLRFLKNNTDQHALDQRNAVSNALFATALEINVVAQMNAGDYMEVQAWQDSGGALDIATSPSYTPVFEVFKV